MFFFFLPQIYMGQPGHGVPEMREKIGLDGHNFCMGGPGVVLNQRAMAGVCGVSLVLKLQIHRLKRRRGRCLRAAANSLLGSLVKAFVCLHFRSRFCFMLS